MNFEKEKKKLKKERKKARKAQKRGITNDEVVTKKWVSNIAKKDLEKILRAFPQIVEGLPKASGRWSIDDLYADGITGLYQVEEKKDV